MDAPCPPIAAGARSPLETRPGGRFAARLSGAFPRVVPGAMTAPPAPAAGPARLAGLAAAGALAIVLAASPTAGRGAEAAPVRRMAAPAWVEHFTPDLSGPASSDGAAADGDGIRFLLRDEQIHAGEQTTFRHFALRFLSQDGVQKNSTLSFSYDPAYQTLRLHQLIVHRGGKTADRLPRQAVQVLQREPNLEDQLYDGRLTATLILEDIRVGDVVEYAYSLRGVNPILAGHFADTFSAGWRDPLPQWRERLLWPANRPLPDIQSHGAACAPRLRALDGGKTTEFRWEADGLPGRPFEGETPSWVDTYGWVQISDFSSWQEVARWSAKLFALAAPDPRQGLPEELRRTVETLRALPGRPAQVIGALRYVQDNYRYLGIEIGENAHQPYPVATVCARRFGDCKDKASLLSTLLRQLGFEADPALVETDYRRAIADWHPMPYAFDHAVVRLRLDGKTYWLDPTREHQGGQLGHVFFPDYGKALVVRDDTAGLDDVTPGAFDDAGYEATSVYRQERYSGPAVLTVRTVLHGLSADHARGHFAGTNREQIERDYLNFYARQHPKIRSLDRVGFTDDRDRNEIVVTERYEVTDLWGQDHDPAAKKLTASFRPAEVKECFSLPSTRLRTMPFGLAFPERMAETIQICLPGSTNIEPEHVEVKDPAFDFDYTSRLERDHNTITLDYRYTARADAVAAARIPEYLAHADRALDHLGYSVSIGRKMLTSAAAPANPPAPAKPEPAAPATADAAASWSPWMGWALVLLGFIVVQVHRSQTRRAVPVPSGERPPPLPLHRCVVCGRTEQRHPELDFRVGADGQDYCQDHSAAAARASGMSDGALPL